MSRQRWSCFILIVISIASSFCEEAPSEKEEEQTVKYTRPEAHSAHLAEPFHDEQEFLKRWTPSQEKKDGVDESISKYDGIWKVESPTENPIEDDLGLILKSEAKHAAISSSLPTKFEFDANPLFLQYEVRFQKPLECGGAYIKLLAESTTAIDLSTFGDKSVYSIMFGPDKCGHDGKMHFIVQHENPSSGAMVEHHAKVPSGDFSKMFDDKKTHLITLIVRPGNTFDILLDKTLINTGSLLNDLEPPINPPKEIDDPADVKPNEWDEREKIPDPDATKPDNWDEDAPKQITDEKAVKPTGWFDDEPEQIPDPAAEKPADWDTEEDGEWEAPLVANPKCADPGCGEWKPPIIDNPAYKGKWVPALISNPAYKGVWAPKKIPNPHYFEDKNPFVTIKPIVAIGYELWSMQSDIVFDNIILASDQETINQWTAQTWDLKRKTEVDGEKGAAASVFSSLYKATEDMPWLWVVYAIVVLLPFVLIYVFCFPSKDKSTAAAADRKKTDEPSPDDVEAEDDNVSNRSVDSSGEEDLMPDLETINDGPVITDVTDEVKETGVEEVQEAVTEVEKKVEEAEKPAAEEEKISENANVELEKEPEKSLAAEEEKPSEFDGDDNKEVVDVGSTCANIVSSEVEEGEQFINEEADAVDVKEADFKRLGSIENGSDSVEHSKGDELPNLSCTFTPVCSSESVTAETVDAPESVSKMSLMQHHEEIVESDREATPEVSYQVDIAFDTDGSVLDKVEVTAMPAGSSLAEVDQQFSEEIEVVNQVDAPSKSSHMAQDDELTLNTIPVQENPTTTEEVQQEIPDGNASPVVAVQCEPICNDVADGNASLQVSLTGGDEDHMDNSFLLVDKDTEPIQKESSDSPDEDEAVLETSPRATRSKKKTRKDT